MKVILEPERVFHIFTHANGSENLFREEGNYRYFLKKYAEHIYPVAETFAYCLMPNHLHLMVRIRKEEEILQVWFPGNSANFLMPIQKLLIRNMKGKVLYFNARSSESLSKTTPTLLH